MESLDLRVIGDALAWHGAGRNVTLVTVVETWGSAPRPAGSVLAIRDDGMVSGSVSGGCVEDDLIARVKAGSFNAPEDFSRQGRPSVISYGVTREEATRFGLPCGGTLCLVQEPLSDVTWLRELLARTTAHELVARTLDLRSGVVRLTPTRRGVAMSFDGKTLTTVFGPRWRLLLIGAGQLSQVVAAMAQALDFEVLVCDPREEYSGAMRIDGVQHVQGMPDDAVINLHPDPHTAIVALTHDSKLDDLALIEALKSDAFYVGALGSRHNQAARKRRLAEHFDLTPGELARLHGPVGLPIGGKTPAEIAVSILAEIVAVKNLGVRTPVATGAPDPKSHGL